MFKSFTSPSLSLTARSQIQYSIILSQSEMFPDEEERVLDWEDISEEEQRIWREDGDFDLSGDSEEDDDSETFRAQLTHEVVIYKINTNYDQKQIVNAPQSVKSF